MSEVYHVDVEGETVDVRIEGNHVVVDGVARRMFFDRRSKSAGHILVDGKSIPIVLNETASGQFDISLLGWTVRTHVKTPKEVLLERYGLAGGGRGGEENIKAPMPGLVLRIAVEEGSPVKKGDGLLVLEAMKMENELHAPCDGVIRGIHVQAGDAVAKQQLLIEIEPGVGP